MGTLRIKELLAERKLSMTELSVMLNVNRISLSKTISEKRGNPSLKTLNKIAEKLEVSVYDLFEKPNTIVVDKISKDEVKVKEVSKGKVKDEDILNGFIQIKGKKIYKVNSVDDLKEIISKLEQE